MKKLVFIMMVLGLTGSLIGCGKKPSVEESADLMSMESISMIGTPESKNANISATAIVPAAQSVSVKLDALPPAVSKPTVQEIQIALKNASFYSGEADGEMGAMTKKAIEAFQKANGLQADGKVGPKTWVLLSTHLSPTLATKGKRPR